jgi:hypothetical protein
LAVYLGTQVGNSGGNIRHTEIREIPPVTITKKQITVANVLKQNDKSNFNNNFIIV